MDFRRPQTVTDADRDIRLFLVRIAAVMGELLGEQLRGVYLHGSLAHGSFRRHQSDINALVVVAGALPAGARASVARALLQLSTARPTPGDIEVTVLRDKYARNFEYPTPYEVQYKTAQHDQIRANLIDFGVQRLDKDLAPAILDAGSRGLRLVGPEPAALFGPVPWYAFINALEAGFELAGERISDAPVDAVLGAARTLHATTQRTLHVASKEEAGRWARAQVPELFRPLIDEALGVRDGTIAAISPQNAALIGDLRSHVFERAQPAFERARDDDEEDEG